MIARRNGHIDHHFALRAPDENDGDLLGAAVRGEGRFNVGVLRNSPFDDARDIVVAPEASAALDIALGQLSSIGHGIEDVVLAHGGVYSDAFRKLWQISAAGIPVSDDNLGLLEPVLALLAALAARRRGQAVVLRALSRHERAAGSVSATGRTAAGTPGRWPAPWSPRCPSPRWRVSATSPASRCAGPACSSGSTSCWPR